MPLGKMHETFLEKHSKKFMKEDKQGKGRIQWTNGRVKENHKRACEKIMLKDGNQSGKCVSELHYRVTPFGAVDISKQWQRAYL